MSELQYTHKEMVKLCDEAKRMMIMEFESMLGDLDREFSGRGLECVGFDDIENGLLEIKENNGLTDKVNE